MLRDHGQGMSEESLQRFRSGTGMGVGLAGMRERVAELGGSMTIESDSFGTIVRVSLPAHTSQQSAGVAGVA
jgi:signal transduction histidine kinase